MYKNRIAKSKAKREKVIPRKRPTLVGYLTRITAEVNQPAPADQARRIAEAWARSIQSFPFTERDQIARHVATVIGEVCVNASVIALTLPTQTLSNGLYAMPEQVIKALRRLYELGLIAPHRQPVGKSAAQYRLWSPKFPKALKPAWLYDPRTMSPRRLKRNSAKAQFLAPKLPAARRPARPHHQPTHRGGGPRHHNRRHGRPVHRPTPAQG